jgi:hypothetical protein
MSKGHPVKSGIKNMTLRMPDATQDRLSAAATREAAQGRMGARPSLHALILHAVAQFLNQDEADARGRGEDVEEQIAAARNVRKQREEGGQQ